MLGASQRCLLGRNVFEELSVVDEVRIDRRVGLQYPFCDLPDAGWIVFFTGGPVNFSVIVAEPEWQP
jgi:hypothetical protein